MTAFLMIGWLVIQFADGLGLAVKGFTHQVITLSGTGEAETPAGGSVCMR